MNTFFLERKNIGMVPNWARPGILTNVKNAAKDGLYVSVRAEEFNGETVPYGDGVYTMTMDEAHNYMNESGGAWTYIPASVWLSE